MPRDQRSRLGRGAGAAFVLSLAGALLSAGYYLVGYLALGVGAPAWLSAGVLGCRRFRGTPIAASARHFRSRRSLARGALSESDLSVEQRATLDGFLSTQVMDERAMLAKSSFPLSEENLIRCAKLYLALNQDDVTAPELLADDFEFKGPIIGPLGKAKYMEQFKDFRFRQAFPDAVNQWHHFRVDPFQPNRVWFTCRGKGTNTGVAPPLISEPTGKTFETPPQACSLTFNEAGEATQYTIGYVLDARQGNTGGIGGLLGILYAIEKPFPYPESYPYQPSWQRVLFNSFVNFLVSLKPK